MRNNRLKIAAILLVAGMALSACADKTADMVSPQTSDPTSGASVGDTTPDDSANEPAEPKQPEVPAAKNDKSNETSENSGNQTPSRSGPPASNTGKSVQVAAKPDDIAVLVNKSYALPDDYKPNDLVYPDVPFLFKEKIEKRMMRKQAAEALEKLFAAAQKDGIHLAGVSAYRSRETQKALFENYAKRDGEEAANRYSAKPRHSEHETGLAIDVSGSDGKCAAEDCFAGTKEAKWLEAHAAEYGFIIRYPKGKEDITGYQYEPWHLRYVGEDIAKQIMENGLTLEEYYNKAVPVSE